MLLIEVGPVGPTGFKNQNVTSYASQPAMSLFFSVDPKFCLEVPLLTGVGPAGSFEVLLQNIFASQPTPRQLCFSKIDLELHLLVDLLDP
jgi:hypothetical protein